MTNYKEQRQAYAELMDLMKDDKFDEDRAVIKLTIKYEVSERAVRKRIDLIRGLKNE